MFRDPQVERIGLCAHVRGYPIILTVIWSAPASRTTNAYRQVGQWRTKGNSNNLVGDVGSLIMLTNRTGHSVRYSYKWSVVHEFGFWATLQPGETALTVGHHNHQAFIYQGLESGEFSDHSDVGLYLGNGN